MVKNESKDKCLMIDILLNHQLGNNQTKYEKTNHFFRLYSWNINRLNGSKYSSRLDRNS